MTELLLGIDVGTTNVKVVLASPSGEVVAEARARHGTARPRPGWAEQDPKEWWRGVVSASREALASAGAAPGQIAGIGVSGQGCAVTLVDGAGRVVRPAITAADSRSEPQCQRLRQRLAGEILHLNGKEPAPYNADPTLMWLQQHEPRSIEAARCSLTTTGYVNLRLTGEATANLSDASILFAFDLAAKGWSEYLIEGFGLPRRLYPPVARCSEVIGALQEDAADALGLPADVPVVAGGEDTSSSGLAVGATDPGRTLLSLGTAGTVYAAQDEPAVLPRMLTFLHVVEGRALLGGSIAAMGAALAWCQNVLGAEMDFPGLTRLAAESEPGAGGVVFLPYLSGELQPINDGNARGVFFGLSLSTGRPQLVRAVMEGAAFAIAHNLRLLEDGGIPVGELRAVGGPTESELWCQIVADVTGRELAVLPDNAGAPLGDALLAAAGVGLVEDPAVAANGAARVVRRHEPREEHRKRYEALFEIYRGLYPTLKEQFAAAAAEYGGAA